MARTHAKLLCSIWSDPDWLKLSATAQRTYFLLLSQPKLSLVGLLDYLPSRWGRFAPDAGATAVEAGIDELEAARFVVVDRDTDELLIRTLVRHDIATVMRNSKLVQGMWNHWTKVESRRLRAVIVAEVPDEIWDIEKAPPPAEALHMRRSAHMELQDRSHSSDCEIEPTDGTSFLQPPASSHLPTPTSRQSSTGDTRGEADDDDLLLDIARARATRLGRSNPSPAWLAATVVSLDTTKALAHAAGGLTVEQIDLELDKPRGRHDPTDQTAAAAQAGYQRNARRTARAFDCEHCEDLGIIALNDGTYDHCNHTKAAAS